MSFKKRSMTMRQIQLPRWIWVTGMLIGLFVGCHSQFDSDETSFLDEHEPDTEKEISYYKTLSDLDLMQMQTTRHEAIRECRQCHMRLTAYRRKQFRKPIPALCYDCHEDFQAKNKYLHGPVAVGECLFCHKPHVSTYIHLQKTTQPKLCSQCHEMQKYTLSAIHDKVKDRLCTQCHDPHGGNRPLFLKEGAELVSP